MNDDTTVATTERVTRMTADIAGCTDVGRQRDHQEDFLSFPYSPLRPEEYEQGLLLIVADGVGGLRAGDEASRLAAVVTRETFYRDWTPSVAYTLERAITTANASVYQRGHESGAGSMATTIVCAVLRGDQLDVAHVGDSRLYRLRGGALQQLTQDHSWVRMQVQLGVLTEEEARTHSKRHVVTRSLGIAPTVDVELQQTDLRHGDRLLLCTDGLYDLVPDDEIAAALIRQPREACDLLVRLANEAGGSDNITVIVALVSLPDELASNRSTRDEEATAERQAYRIDDEDQTAERPVGGVV